MLILAAGLIVISMLLVGAVHHHHGDDTCWYCAIAAIAMLPFAALALFPLGTLSRPRAATCLAPARMGWNIHRRRGPPVTD